MYPKDKISDKELNELLDSSPTDYPNSPNSSSPNSPNASSVESLIPVILQEGEIDPRLKLLSHSSRTTLHKCPRKYQLYRMSSEEKPLEDQKAMEQRVTFAYGSAVGVGIASTLEGNSEAKIILDTFLAWDTDLLDFNPKQKKSYWLTQFAVQKFIALRESGFLNEYELVTYTSPVTGEENLPATELGFQVSLPNGFKYRGFVDAVLRHKETNDIMVLECKTSSSNANPSMFKNSGQALGYSVVLDILFPKLSSYTVLYLVYETKRYEYVELPFKKSLLQRALWLQELLIDSQAIELYHSYDIYPMHGEACFDFFRDCEYLSLCTLDTGRLTKQLTKGILDRMKADEDRYEFKIEFNDLIDAQIAKAEE